MDKSKYDKIRDFLNYSTDKYTVSNLAEYVARVAPNLKTNSDRDYNNAMNAFLGAVCGVDKPERQGTPIPRAAADGFDMDAWIWLGNHDITLEDCADFVSEYKAKTMQAEWDKNMEMSKILHAMPSGTQGAGDLIERHERITAPPRKTVSEFLRDLPADDAKKITLR